ncbi:MAG: ADP-ribose pyrophosphatase [Halovenus sp.]
MTDPPGGPSVPGDTGGDTDSDGESAETERWDWPVVESVVEYDNEWYTGGYDLVEQPDGTRKRYYWAKLPPAVVVVAAANGKLVMVEQYRPAIAEHCLELPAGIVERGESATTAGARELREETGFEAAGVSLLESFWCTTGLLCHRRSVVFAEGLSPVEPDLDANEFLSVRAVPVEEALGLARAPPANDATIEGLLLARETGVLSDD